MDQRLSVMIWNVALLIVSIGCLILFAIIGLVEYVPRAEVVAYELAPQIGVDEDVLRQHLYEVLKRDDTRQVIIYSTPWAFMSLLLATRLIVDFRGRIKEVRTH